MRGRVSAAVVTALVLAAIVAPAASAACPNEAFRTGPSAQLPECRAYEQVTPVDKESAFPYSPTGGIRASSAGGGLLFSGFSAFARAQSNFSSNPYVSTRGPDSWSTQSVGGLQAAFATVVEIPGLGASDDLSSSMVVSKEALAPGAVPGGSNIYVRDNRTATYSTVAAIPGDTGFGAWTTNTQAPLIGAAADWSTLLLRSSQPLTSDAPQGQNLYEFRDGRTRLVVAGGAAAALTEATPNVMSADGSRFFYLQEGRLYLHRLGAETLLVSEDEEGNPVTSSFVGATPDGEIAFFLVGTPGSAPPSGSLYRFEASASPGHRITRLTPALGESEEPSSVTAAVVGEDGTTVYFSATRQLTPDAQPIVESGGYDIYAWHGVPGQAGAIRYIAQGNNFSSKFAYASVSPDGRFLGFESLGKVTPDAVDGVTCTAEGAAGCTNVFSYSLDADRLDCVSCSGSPAAGSSHLGGLGSRYEESVIYSAVGPVLDGGFIYFDTPNPVSQRDVNGVGDTYGWHDGQAQLISTGTDPRPSGFVDASPSGGDIFFSTRQSLVGQDIDSIVDIYDARVGGGLAQGGPTVEPPCIVGDGCRSGVIADPPTESPGSSVLNDAGAAPNACPVSRRKARAAHRHAQKLMREAGRARGRHAKALRERAARTAKVARRLDRRAGHCKGGRR